MAAFPSMLGEAPAALGRRTIPYDYSFAFTGLRAETGVPPPTATARITVSVEASFIAVAIGYGLVPKVTPIRFGGGRKDFAPPRPAQTPTLPTAALAPVSWPPPVTIGNITLGQLLRRLAGEVDETEFPKAGRIGPKTAALLESGVKLNPATIQQVLLKGPDKPLDDSVLEELFQVVSVPSFAVQFRYALFDEATGRAFQNEPILSTAGLGIANGDRPFRCFARPITFAPRSTIRMEVSEISAFQGDLYVSLHGYKVLGGPGTPTAAPGLAPGGARRRRTRR